jgi:hypothetical protein
LLIVNRLGGYCILPIATVNCLGRDSYFYNCPLAVIVFITGGFKTAFQFGFWAGFGQIFNFSKKYFK